MRNRMPSQHARSNCVGIHSRIGSAADPAHSKERTMADDFENHCWKTSSRRTCWTSTAITSARRSSARRRRCWRSISMSWPIRAAPSRWRNCTRPIRAPAARMPMRRSSRPSGCSPPPAPRAFRSSTPPRIRGPTACRRASPRPGASACRTIRRSTPSSPSSSRSRATSSSPSSAPPASTARR